jgi:hypothetical protein
MATGSHRASWSSATCGTAAPAGKLSVGSVVGFTAEGAEGRGAAFCVAAAPVGMLAAQK